MRSRRGFQRKGAKNAKPRQENALAFDIPVGASRSSQISRRGAEAAEFERTSVKFSPRSPRLCGKIRLATLLAENLLFSDRCSRFLCDSSRSQHLCVEESIGKEPQLPSPAPVMRPIQAPVPISLIRSPTDWPSSPSALCPPNVESQNSTAMTTNSK